MGAKPVKNTNGFGNEEISSDKGTVWDNYFKKETIQPVRATTGDVLKCKCSFEFVTKQSPAYVVGSWGGRAVVTTFYRGGTSYTLWNPEDSEAIENYFSFSGSILYMSGNELWIGDRSMFVDCNTFRFTLTGDLWEPGVLWNNDLPKGSPEFSQHLSQKHTIVKNLSSIITVELFSYSSLPQQVFEYQNIFWAREGSLVWQVHDKKTSTRSLLKYDVDIVLLNDFIILNYPDQLQVLNSLNPDNVVATFQTISTNPNRRARKYFFATNDSCAFFDNTDIYLIFDSPKNGVQLLGRCSTRFQLLDACYWGPEFIVGCSPQGFVELWEIPKEPQAAPLKEFYTFKAHKYEISFVRQWKAWLVTAGTDLEIKIWNKNFENIVSTKVKNQVTGLDFCDNYLIASDYHGTTRALEMRLVNIRLLLLARYFAPESFFYKDHLPTDMFREIISRI